MGGNGVNFNAPKDTTGVNRVNMQNVLRTGLQAGAKAMINSVFTQAKDSTGHVGGKPANYEGGKTHTDYQNGKPVGTANYEPSGREYNFSGDDGSLNYEKDYYLSGKDNYNGTMHVDGTVHYVADVDEEGSVTGEAHYEGDKLVEGKIE